MVFDSVPGGQWVVGLKLFVATFADIESEMRVGDRSGHTWKSWLLLIPIAGASLITITRLMDYRHHAGDVIAGALLGIVSSWYCYRQFYPVSPVLRSAFSVPLKAKQGQAVWAVLSHQPYDPRVARGDPERTNAADLPLYASHTSP